MDTRPRAAQTSCTPNTAIVVVGLAAFFAWQSALANYLFPPSANAAVSPLFAASFASSLIAAYCYLSYKHDSDLLSPTRLTAWFVTCAVAGSVAACLVSLRVLAPWGIYAAGLVSGYSWSSCAYLWASVATRMPKGNLFGIVMAALAISAFADFAFMHGGDFGSAAAAPVFGGVQLIAFCVASRGGATAHEPILVRPRNVASYIKLAAAVTLLAAALGVTAGSTAHSATEDGMSTFNRYVALVALATGAVLLCAWFVSKKRVTFSGTLLVFIPTLVLVMLMNIIAAEQTDAWLSITLFSWRLLCVLAFGLLIVIANRGIASLALLFPAGWSVMCGGYSLGILFGQAVCPYFVTAGSSSQGMSTVVVGVVMATVVSAMLMFSGRTSTDERANTRLPQEAIPTPADEQAAFTSETATSAQSLQTASETAVAASSQTPAQPNAPTQASTGSAPEAAPSSAPDPLRPYEATCQRIGERYKLSPREVEVMELLVHGHTRAAIAKKLFVSENTVRAHVKAIYSKLSIHSKQQLIDFVESRL